MLGGFEGYVITNESTQVYNKGAKNTNVWNMFTAADSSGTGTAYGALHNKADHLVIEKLAYNAVYSYCLYAIRKQPINVTAAGVKVTANWTGSPADRFIVAISLSSTNPTGKIGTHFTSKSSLPNLSNEFGISPIDGTTTENGSISGTVTKSYKPANVVTSVYVCILLGLLKTEGSYSANLNTLDVTIA